MASLDLQAMDLLDATSLPSYQRVLFTLTEHRAPQASWLLRTGTQPLPRGGQCIPTAPRGLAELQGVFPSLSSLLQVPLTTSLALKPSSSSADKGDFCLLCGLLIRIWKRRGPTMGLGGVSITGKHQVGCKASTATL